MDGMSDGISQEESPTSSSHDDADASCPICGKDPICDGLGVIRYDVPTDDPRFGKMFRCPNNPVELDVERQNTLRKIGNLGAFSDKTFDNFQTTPSMCSLSAQQSLRYAHDVALSFAQNPKGWLLLEGTYGCGKTHLAAAVGNMYLQSGSVVLFITTPDLLDHLRGAYGPSSETGYDETFERVRNAELLVLDDLGIENPSPWAQEKLFQLLNYRYSRHLPTIITTNVDIDSLDPRIRSRLLDENVIRRVKISAPDFRTEVQSQETQLLSNLSLYHEMTFDSFDVKTKLRLPEQRNLEEALDMAYNYARNPEGWFILSSKYYGCGKTHLAAAIAHYRREQGTEVVFLTVPDLLDYLRVTFDPNVSTSFDQRFQAMRNAPFLVLDDFNSKNTSAWSKEKLFQILDYRHISRLPTVITISAKNIESLDQRIESRFMDRRCCMIFSIISPDYPSRMARTQIR